jgi:hypothetical protein
MECKVTDLSLGFPGYGSMVARRIQYLQWVVLRMAEAIPISEVLL